MMINSDIMNSRKGVGTMKRRRIWAAAWAALLCLTLTGCLFRSPEELYRPPEKSAGYEQLNQAIRQVRNGLEAEYGVTAEDASIISGDNTATIQVGIMKIKVAQSRLRLDERKNKVTLGGKKGSVGKNITSRAERTGKNELDLRGMTAEEALIELDRFIDGAVLAGLGTITIIHGKGTGALRAAVHRDLKQNKSIKTFRLGVYGEGEDGVTIAELK